MGGKKNYLYHLVKRNLQGNVLYPLNALKDKHPAIYEQRVGKYAGREHVIQQRIPHLNCQWSDVLHFSAVNPKDVKQVLIEAGHNLDFYINYYQVEPKLIEPEHSIVYLFTRDDDEAEMDARDFVPYDPDELAQFSFIPEATKTYYREMISLGKWPLLYYRVPHILYKGALDLGTTNIKIISV